MVNGDKLIGTTEHLTLQASCHTNRRRYNRVLLYACICVCMCVCAYVCVCVCVCVCVFCEATAQFLSKLPHY
jgi:hypothetical protein